MLNTRKQSRKVSDRLLGDTGPSNQVNKAVKRKGVNRSIQDLQSNSQDAPNKKKKTMVNKILMTNEAPQTSKATQNPSIPLAKCTKGKAKSSKTVSTVIEDNQIFTMEAEGVESEFPDSNLESDGDLEVSFKNSQESQDSIAHKNNAMPEHYSDVDESNHVDESDVSEGEYESENEVPQDPETNTAAEIESDSGEEIEGQDLNVLKKVQKLMAKEGFKESAKFLKTHIQTGSDEKRKKIISGGKGVARQIKDARSKSAGRHGMNQLSTNRIESHSKTTIYKDAVKRNSSSSEDESPVDNLIDIHEYVSGHPSPQHSDGQRRSFGHQAVLPSQGGGDQADQPPLSPEDRADHFIREAEMSLARLYLAKGKQDDCTGSL